MGQNLPTDAWVRSARCESNGCIELNNEGDGNILVRSSRNRDRWIRLTWEELSQLADIALFPTKVIVVAEPASAR